MTSLFSSPSPPDPPEVSTPEDTSTTTEAEKRRKARLKRGLSSTLLAPVGEELSEVQPKTLFGIA